MTTVRIDLPWTTPPLTANQRMHWAKRAAVVKEVRQTTGWLARGAPRADRIVITLHYRPRDIRRRDAHNLYPLVKACCDGIVDAKIVDDDDTAHVSTPEPVIHQPDGKRAAMWLEIDYPDTGAAA
jgi:hypothetical protein